VIAHGVTVIAHGVMVIARAQPATVLSAVLAHRNAMATAQHVIQIDHVVTLIDHSAVIRATDLAETQNAQTVTLRQETTASLAPIQHR